MDTVSSFRKIVTFMRLNFSSDTRIYLVGGVVRDLILGIPSNDIDIVLTGNVRSISRSIANHFSGNFYPLDERRHTYRVILHNSTERDMILDIALMRGSSIEEDLSDRDFTINAIALDVTEFDGVDYIDPLDGIKSIENQIISVCSEKSLVSDPVRVLRAIRFACQFNSVIDNKTIAAMHDAVSHLNEISSERLRDEFFKMLGKPYTRECLNQYLQFDVAQRLFPDFGNYIDDWKEAIELINELNHFLIESEGFNKEQVSHKLFMGNFQKDVCGYLNDEIVSDRSVIKLLNLGILLRQEYSCFLGRKFNGGNRKNKLQSFLKERGADFVLSNQEINFLRKLINNWDIILDPNIMTFMSTPIDIYRFFRSAGNAGIGLCLILCASVGRFSEDTQEKIFLTIPHLFSAYWNSYHRIISPESFLDGNDLIHEFHLKPGPQFKIFLEELREAQVSGIVNNRDEAMFFIKQKLKVFSETGNWYDITTLLN